jgi:hypothetical protein
MLGLVDRSTVEVVFRMFRPASEDRPRYVLLMKDGGYLCSCMTLQHVGIVCRHYFRLITRVPKCRYHISLIPRRWFHEQHQGLKDSDKPSPKPKKAKVEKKEELK